MKVGSSLPAFRNLSLRELNRNLKDLRNHLIADESLEDELKEFADGLLAHLIQMGDGSFEYVERTKPDIEALPQNRPGRALLLADLNDYLLAPPNMRERIKDRLNRGLVNKPPEPEKKKSKAAAEVGGRTFPFAEGLGPDD